jgi:phenylalanyl-tRNA synthetase beta chain
MNFSYNWLKDYVKNMPRADKLPNLLTLNFAEVEDFKKNRNDFVLDIDVRPNRAADCFSHLGVAREIAAITGSKFILPPFKPQVSTGLKTADFIKIEVKDKRACLRYLAKVVTDVKVGQSPKWLQERLKACGLRPINNVVDIANYVMIETGQPLHTFDGDKLKGKKIKVRFAKKGESMVTLDEDKFELDTSILVIADEQDPVAVAGIKGGIGPGIDKKTKTVIIEAANFSPRLIRKASRKIGLKTDASLRFEHGLDPNLAELAANRTAYLIQKICKGRVPSDCIDIYPNKVLPLKIKLDLDYLNSLLGVNIPKAKVLQILKRLDFKILKQGQKSLLVEAPTIRTDVSLVEDLIEEIGRINGYDKIPAVFPLLPLAIGKKNNQLFIGELVKDILKEAGFFETYNYSFIGEKEVKIFNYNSDDLIELQNPISLEQKYLRCSLIPGLLCNVSKNINNFSEIKLFELGKVFIKSMASKDKKQLAGAYVGGDFYKLKGAIDLLLTKLGIDDFSYDDCQEVSGAEYEFICHPKKCGQIKIKGKIIGFLGEVSPKITQQLEISQKTIIFSIDAEALLAAASLEKEFNPIAKFPSVIRDLAILVPRKTKVAEVLNKIKNSGEVIIKEVEVFDIYQGEELPDQKKNLAFRITYQAKDRTLKSEEADQIQNKIMKNLEKNPNWNVRR